MAARTIAGHSVPFIFWLLFWIVVIILLMFVAGAIIHATHEPGLDWHFQIGYFRWDIGFD
jgi:hypothetical protein